MNSGKTKQTQKKLRPREKGNSRMIVPDTNQREEGPYPGQTCDAVRNARRGGQPSALLLPAHGDEIPIVSNRQ